MSKLLITGPINKFEKVIETLHQLKVLHVIDHAPIEDLDIGSPAEKAEKLSATLVSIRSIISHLKLEKRDVHGSPRSFADIAKQTEKINSELTAVRDRWVEIEDKSRMYEQQLEDLQVLSALDLNIESLQNYSSMTVFVGYGDREIIQQKIAQHTKLFDTTTGSVQGKELVAVFVENGYAEKTKEILSGIGFSEFALTNVSEMKGKPSTLIHELERKQHILLKQRSVFEKKTDELRRKHVAFLTSAEKHLDMELVKAEAPLKCGVSKRFFTIRGYVPQKDMDKVVALLHKAANKKISIKHDIITDDESVPVKLDNIARTKPFEFFLNLYTLPSYRELDPTSVIFWTFPLLFGFILGDVGYGLVTFALFWFMKKKFKASLFDIGIYSSFGSIFFGLLFGEVFGEEVLFGFHLPHILSRAHDIISLLYLALVVGIIHVNLGLLIGFYNEFRHHGFRGALFEKGSWIVLQVGAALLALSYMQFLAISVWFGYAVLAVAIVMLYKGEGVRGLIEIPGIFSNILSYARLMAVGLSSVLIAIVVNDFAREFFHAGGFMILAGIVLLIVGHGINIALGLLGAFLHSLRLHYVEFFSKFYKGGGKDYVPFGTGG